jgi:hypothetical protein
LHSDAQIQDIRHAISPLIFLDKLGHKVSHYHRIDGGTLSSAFILNLSDEKIFLKTHILPDGSVTLLKEYELLDKLYSNEMSINKYIITNDLSTERKIGSLLKDQLWLSMPVLDHGNRPLTPDEILDVLDKINLKLCPIPHYSTTSGHDTIETIHSMAHGALDALSQANLLDNEAKKSVKLCLSIIENEFAKLNPTICHGDLSPANIMYFKNKPIFIDWEDSFIGFQEYDYLYWLTFFENRQYYTHQPLGKLKLDINIARATLVMIVLLKCEIAWRSNAWLKHSLNFSDRIFEVFHLN